MSGNSSNWPIQVTGYDSLRIMTKRSDRQGRMSAPISAADLLGPGMSSQAVHILDWNDPVATFNGFFYTTAGGLNSPVVEDDDGEEVADLPWIGTAIARQDGTGTHQVWNTDDPSSMYFRVRNWAPNPLDADGPPIYGDWQRFATRSGFIAEEDLHPDVRDQIDEALEKAEEALGLIIPPNYIFRQDTEPVSTEEHELLNYDMWFDTNDDDRFYVYFDGAWVEPDDEILSGAGAAAAAAMADAIAAANAAADAIVVANDKSKTYRQDTEPTGGTYFVGDTWEDTNDLNKPYRWNGSAWVLGITGWLQTDAAANRGVKVTSAGLAAYNSSGSPTFTIDGSTGSVAMLGDLVVGSTITGATITGTLQTTTTANRGVKITNTGMVFYDIGGSPVLSYSSTTGILSVTGPIVSGANISGSSVTASSGGVIQSESTANRGVKINSAGLVAYDAGGSPTFTVVGATGVVTAVGGVFNSVTLTGATIQSAAPGSARMEISGTLIQWKSSGGTVTSSIRQDAGGPLIASDALGYSIGFVSGVGFTVNGPGRSTSDWLVGGGLDVTSLANGGSRHANTGTKYVRADDSGQIWASTVAPSSRDIKHDIDPLDVDFRTLLALVPRTYRFNESPAMLRAGFIAEDAAALGLDLWVGREDPDDETKPTGFDYDGWDAALHLICREQQALIDDQAEQIADLTERVAALEN